MHGTQQSAATMISKKPFNKVTTQYKQQYTEPQMKQNYLYGHAKMPARYSATKPLTGTSMQSI